MASTRADRFNWKRDNLVKLETPEEIKDFGKDTLE
ncbi:unnamed protein product, partial [marine sediment metagenome]